MADANAAKIQAERDALAKKALDQGLLDDNFSQLVLLQDDSQPEFVQDVIQLYFSDSKEKLDKLDQLFAGPPDFDTVNGIVHQFKGSSSSIGAPKVASACATLRKHCDSQDREAAEAQLEKVKKEFRLPLLASFGPVREADIVTRCPAQVREVFEQWLELGQGEENPPQKENQAAAEENESKAAEATADAEGPTATDEAPAAS
eukprot:scaffold516_cov401-Prasinococcus_capsulatus_cf.AAC.5